MKFDMLRGLEILTKEFGKYMSSIECQNSSHGVEVILVLHHLGEVYKQSFIILPEDSHLVCNFRFIRAINSLKLVVGIKV